MSSVAPSATRPIARDQEGDWTRTHAALLLKTLHGDELQLPAYQELHPALDWSRSGLMQLSGEPDAAQMCPVPLTAQAQGALLALSALSDAAPLRSLQASRLLTERAALNQWQRAGRQSVGGACRLLDVADGRLALSLARDDDWALLPAWLEAEVSDWSGVQAIVAQRPLAPLLARAELLGLAAAADAEPSVPARSWYQLHAGRAFGATSIAPRSPPIVMELASLWAGPLCGHLLQLAGAEVIKLESRARPDGARRGNAAFYDQLNAGKRSVVLDFASARGRAQLRELLSRADIVIEGSRPRALRQLGIDAEQLIADKPDLSWIAISAYGREPELEQRIGYGDDAAVAAGLSAIQQQASGLRHFVGDAIADPLTGMHAALLAWASHRQGGGRLLSIALRDTVAYLIAQSRPEQADGWHERYQRWTALLQPGDRGAPQARVPHARAAELGADTAAVLARWGL